MYKYISINARDKKYKLEINKSKKSKNKHLNILKLQNTYH